MIMYGIIVNFILVTASILILTFSKNEKGVARLEQLNIPTLIYLFLLCLVPWLVLGVTMWTVFKMLFFIKYDETEDKTEDENEDK